MKKLVVLMTMLSLNVQAAGGWLAYGVNITSVTNTGSNEDVFEVVTSGANNNDRPCQGEKITFHLAQAGDLGGNENIHNRAFTLALSAMVASKEVNIYSYTDSKDCSSAAYIQFRN